MKVRTGFVSNSSSSSFLIYGVASTRSEFIELVGLEPDSDEAVALEDDIYGWCEENLPSLTHESPYDSGMHFVGLSWDAVGDDETGKQFKNRVFKELKKVFPNIKKEQLGTHAEAWHD